MEKLKIMKNNAPANTENVEIFYLKEIPNKKNRAKKICFVILVIFITAWFIVGTTLYLISFTNGFKLEHNIKIIDVAGDTNNWQKNTNDLDLFKEINDKGEKILYPGQKGETSFIIRNLNPKQFIYSIDLYEKNQKNINMKYKLKINNVYILSSKDKWLSTEEMHLSEIEIPANSETIFTLEWYWDDEDNNNRSYEEEKEAIYTVYLDVYSKSK